MIVVATKNAFFHYKKHDKLLRDAKIFSKKYHENFF